MPAVDALSTESFPFAAFPWRFFAPARWEAECLPAKAACRFWAAWTKGPWHFSTSFDVAPPMIALSYCKTWILALPTFFGEVSCIHTNKKIKAVGLTTLEALIHHPSWPVFAMAFLGFHGMHMDSLQVGSSSDHHHHHFKIFPGLLWASQNWQNPLKTVQFTSQAEQDLQTSTRKWREFQRSIANCSLGLCPFDGFPAVSAGPGFWFGFAWGKEKSRIDALKFKDVAMILHADSWGNSVSSCSTCFFFCVCLICETPETSQFLY